MAAAAAAEPAAGSSSPSPSPSRSSPSGSAGDRAKGVGAAASDLSYVDLDLDGSTMQGTPGGKAAADLDFDNAGGGWSGDPVKPQLVGRSESGGSPTTAPSPLPTVRPLEEAVELAEQQVTRARQVSFVSLAASLLAACLGLGIGISEEVLSLVGFGVESLLDGISSALVLWRFKRPKQRQHVDLDAAMQHKLQRDARRERNSSIGIGATFVASACLLAISSAVKYAAFDPDAPVHKEEESAGAFYGTLLSWPSAIFFGGLAYVKFRLGQELQSQVLKKDALCSVLGAILALIVAIASLIELASSDNPKGMEMVDVYAGLIIALLLGAEGARTLWHNLSGLWRQQHQPMA